MPGDNNFLQFDINKLLMLSDAHYNASLTRLNGVSAGQASAALHNKLFYQVSTFIVAFAQAMSNANFNATDGDLATLTTNITNFLNKGKQLPVGSLYLNADVPTNPNTILGYGTWVAFASGQMLLGVSETHEAGSTGGAETVTLTSDELPLHYHEFGADDQIATQGGYTAATAGFPYDADSHGGGGGQNLKTKEFETRGNAHDNMPPYITVYIWKRTA